MNLFILFNSTLIIQFANLASTISIISKCPCFTLAVPTTNSKFTFLKSISLNSHLILPISFLIIEFLQKINLSFVDLASLKDVSFLRFEFETF
jgi:hypothetical protein